MKIEVGKTAQGFNLKLPLALVTQTLAILAIKGAGKSYTSSVIAEEMLDAGQQIVAIDPTGAWWGLRSSADGKKPGYPVVVFGGDHGDVPLEEGSGEALAAAIVENRFSAIIDISNFRKGQARRFVTDLLETLYRLNRQAMHLFIDEADDICPQRVGPEEARMVGAAEDIVKRGRKKGIGCTLITQRPAALNKDVLTQCEVLIALRMNHPLDIKAIREWVNVQAADMEKAKLMIESLPSQENGSAWFWSPGWGRFFEHVKVRARRTFDSGKTPEPGKVAVKPKVMAKVDIQRLGQQIAETVQRTKDNDPKALQRQVVDLKAKLAAAERAPKPTQAPREKIVPAVKDKQIERLEKIGGKLVSLGQAIITAVKESNRRPIQISAAPAARYTVPPTPRISVRTPTSTTEPGERLQLAERKILTALAQYPAGRSKVQAAVLTGYAVAGGGFCNALGALRSKGFVEGRENLIATESGLIALGSWTPLPSGEELLNYWKARLPKCERALIEQLAAVFPDRLTKERLGELAGYEPKGGGFANALGRLRTLELVEGYDQIGASKEFFQ